MTRVAIAVVEWDDHFLVGTRAANQPLAGLAEFPGGKLEPGETPAAAAVRECREETGLAVEVVGEYPTVTHRYDHGLVEIHFLRCRPLPNQPPPLAPFRWLARHELASLQFPAANAALMAELLPEM